jgi:hypothetical protein
MEIQKGKYREFIDEVNKIKGFDGTQLTAQQKGLNELGKEGLEKYARVMVSTTQGSSGDFEKLNFDISKLTNTEIDELNSLYKEQVKQSFLGAEVKLLEWYPLKIEKINEMSSIHISWWQC